MFATPLLIILVLSLGLYLSFVKYPVFDIDNIEIFGTKNFVNETDLRELARTRAYGRNLFSFSSKKLRESLLKDFQGAKDLLIGKKMPSTIKITVIERVPLALIHDPELANFFLVDEDGYVLGQVEPGTTNFPEISYSGAIEVGYFLDEETVSIYFELLKAIDVEKIAASSMSVHSDHVAMYVEGAVEVFVAKDKNIPQVISTLSRLLKQLATEGKDVKRVDLRYDKVIVSYW